ncbi:MAG: nitroreductase [Planctomycetaceae bacterium]|nr:nitroreductase [Planctomycetaceae bacterium]MBQ2822833.1 nitroreductase family protein [Thermoguttaceae bacterium]
MEFFDVIQNRHSYRGNYLDQPVPREDLLKIAEAGRLAPTGKNAQTCSFVLIDDPQILARLGEMFERPASMKSAKAAIAVIAKPSRIFMGHSFHVEDFSAAVENMLLTITDLGYASVWVQGGLFMNGAMDQINQMLNVPIGQSVEVLLPIGVPAETCASPTKKPLEERIIFNRF